METLTSISGLYPSRHFDIRFDNTVYAITGSWQTRQMDRLDSKADLNFLPLSFNNQFVTDNVTLIHPDDIGALRTILLAAKPADKIEYRFKIITSDRDILLVEGSGVLDINPYVGQRMNTGEAILQQHVVAQIADAVPDMISVMEFRTKKVTYLNRATFTAQGFNPEEMVRKSHDDLKSLTHPEDRAVLDAYYRQLEYASDDQIVEADYRAVRRENDWQWFHVRGKVFQRNDNGDVTHIVNVIENITDRKKVEREIKENRDLLQNIMNAPNVGIGVFKAIRDASGEIQDFRFEFVNRRTLNAFQGIDPTGTLLTAYGNDGKEQLQFFAEAIKTGKSNSYTRKAQSGIVEGWFLFSNAPLDNDRVVQVWEDITEIKKAEQEILHLKDEVARKATDRYYSLFNSIDEGFCVIEMLYDQHGKVTDWKWLEVNAAYERHTGISDPSGKLGSAVSPNMESYWREICEKVLQTGESTRFEDYHHDTRRWYSTYLSPVGGKASHQLALIFSDITERKRHEQNLALLKDVTDNLVQVVNIDETMNALCERIGTHFKAAACAFLEIDGLAGTVRTTSAWYRSSEIHPGGNYIIDECYPKDVQQLLHAGNPEIVHDTSSFAVIAKNMEALAPGAYVNMPFVREGRWRATLNIADANPRDWRDDEVNLMRELIFRTWTRLEQARAEEALRKSEEQLRALNARLQETDKAKTIFFNNVSHEFRTPLTLLIGPLEELIKSGGSKLLPDDMQKLQFAYRSAIRLQKLVTILLDFARIEAGKLEAYYQPTDFSKTTVELASTFRSAIEKAGLKYVVKAEQIAEPIYLNREMWEKIVFNLLSNAFKFTHKGKIEVIIREKKKNAELHVKDTGVGIASKDIHRIFDRFIRIEGMKARTNEGTGIGLALVRELVAVHGGAIKVKSTEGTGSEFIVSIPKGKAHFAKHQIFENRERPHVPDLKDSFVKEVLGWLPEDVKNSRRRLKQYQKEGASRVLIVEDNADMREYLTTVLSEDDHKIFAIEDGQKVINFLEEGGHADLIVADVMMPVLDGFEMVRTLKANPKFADIPVILLTAKATEEAKIEGLRLGADAYLTKPFSAKELRAIVLSCLTRAGKHKNEDLKE